MKYERFEDLPVWKAAFDFALRVFALTSDRAFNGAGDLRDQLQRSSLSISQNVAEGFERGSTNELLYYLRRARLRRRKPIRPALLRPVPPDGPS